MANSAESRSRAIRAPPRDSIAPKFRVSTRTNYAVKFLNKRPPPAQPTNPPQPRRRRKPERYPALLNTVNYDWRSASNCETAARYHYSLGKIKCASPSRWRPFAPRRVSKSRWKSLRTAAKKLRIKQRRKRASEKRVDYFHRARNQPKYLFIG